MSGQSRKNTLENSGQNPLGTEKISKLMLKFAVPSIIAMLVGALYNIVDQLFIGQSVGTLGNAATNIAFPLTTSCLALALLFGIGGASCFNLSMGEGDKEHAGYYTGNAVICGDHTREPKKTAYRNNNQEGDEFENAITAFVRQNSGRNRR